MNKKEIYNYCKTLVKKENAEFIYAQSEEEIAEINKYSIENYKLKIADKLFIRVIEKNSIGSFSIQDITKENILNGIKKAKEIAKLKKSEVKFKEFGKNKAKNKIKFDSKINNINFSELLEDIKKNLIKEKYITGYLGSISKNNSDYFYINPYTEKENQAYSLYQTTTILTKNKKKSSGDFSSIYTKLNDININENFLQAKINANILMDPENGTAGEYTLILTPEITRELMGFIISGTTGDLIQKKESFLHKDMGKQIFSKNISILEKPHIDYFLGSRIIDDEGFKTSEKEIIKKGIFKKPIYDLYTSIKYKTKPTGNGFLNNNYNPAYTNKIQLAGTKKINDIISKVKKGVVVYQILGFHTNKLTTGDFSLTISSGKTIVNGNLNTSITNINITGNFKDLLKDAYFSKEQKFFGNSLYSFTIIPKVKLL